MILKEGGMSAPDLWYKGPVWFIDIIEDMGVFSAVK